MESNYPWNSRDSSLLKLILYWTLHMFGRKEKLGCVRGWQRTSGRGCRHWPGRGTGTFVTLASRTRCLNTHFLKSGKSKSSKIWIVLFQGNSMPLIVLDFAQRGTFKAVVFTHVYQLLSPSSERTWPSSDSKTACNTLPGEWGPSVSRGFKVSR